MNGILEITLNGRKERLRINNFARDVLRPYFAGDKPYLSNGELMQAIIKRHKESETLLLKKIVYAGIVGDSFIDNDVPRLTEKEVGEFIGQAQPEELLRIWREFLSAQGFDLSHDESEVGEEVKELDPEEEKKKTKIT